MDNRVVGGRDGDPRRSLVPGSGGSDDLLSHGRVSQAQRAHRAALLKERIYLAFATLAVVVTLFSHGVGTAGEAVATILVTALGTLSAIFTADIISHVVIHSQLMNRAELRSAVASSFGALGTIVVPLAFLGAAALGWWSTSSALRAGAVALVLSLVFIGLLAVRQIPLPWWQRVIVLAAEAILGIVVIGLQLLAHG